MSTTKRVSLSCDYSTSSSTRACSESFTGESDRVGEVREAAAAHGWTHKGGDDGCPLHPVASEEGGAA